MDVEITVNRIKSRSKDRGFKMKFICSNLGVRDNYFTDCRNKGVAIPEETLKAVATMLDTTVAYLTGETDDPVFHVESVGLKTMPYQQRGMRPVFGHASAGLGVLAEQENMGYEPVAPDYDTDEYFWLQVSGDSMSPKIDDGDLVLVNREAPIETNTIMVVIVDDTEGFIKKVSVDEDTVTLISFNPYYPPMVFGGAEMARLRFIGKVVEQKRKF